MPIDDPTQGSLFYASFRLLADSVPDCAVYILDPDGLIATWNEGAARIKGYRADEVVGRHFALFYTRDDVAAGRPDKDLAMARASDHVEMDGWRVRKDGSRFWAHLTITAIRDDDGELLGFGKVTRDLTELRKAEQARSEQRRLLAHLVDAQETERRRIAWDIHDDTIQAMVAVGMRLQLLASGLPAKHQPAVSSLADTVATSISRLRSLVFRLRPLVLEELGLVAAIAAYLDHMAPTWEFDCLLRDELDCEPSLEVATTIFRITQEALTNVHKHARATQVEIELSTKGDGLLVHVRDDGTGVALDDLAGRGESYGCVEMRERADAAGGWWRLESEPGHGTTVRFWVPAGGDSQGRS